MTIDDYKLKLIDKILHAQSGDDIRRFIHVAFKCLAEKKVHGHIVLRFVGKLIRDLENPGAKELKNSEILNSEIAKQELMSIRKELTGIA